VVREVHQIFYQPFSLSLSLFLSLSLRLALSFLPVHVRKTSEKAEEKGSGVLRQRPKDLPLNQPVSLLPLLVPLPQLPPLPHARPMPFPPSTMVLPRNS